MRGGHALHPNPKEICAGPVPGTQGVQGSGLGFTYNFRISRPVYDLYWGYLLLSRCGVLVKRGNNKAFVGTVGNLLDLPAKNCFLES